ncbi:Pr6Pr family membrane protein [Microbacterium deminutum]|uniref:Pr6Pr family membrane protein n=1 Tax=Microbacterium deminutum TaxID=344164 RepID=A0ABN2QIS2_9MICO
MGSAERTIGDWLEAVTPERVARLVFGIGRLLCAAAVLVAMVARYYRGMAWVSLADFVAYLTIQSNAAFVVVATVAGVVALRSGLDHPRLDVARVAVLTWVVTAGILFALIVQQSGARGLRIDVAWSDIALHFVLPGFAVLDWVLSPRRHRVSFRVLVPIVGYPVVWGIITLIRGTLVGWYPYYFLDPTQISSPLQFATLSGLMLAGFAVVGVVFIALPSRGWGLAASLRTVRASGGPSG